MSEPLPLDAVPAKAFERDGYIVLRQACPPATRRALEERVRVELEAGAEPVEYEADVGYPGAPTSRQARGGSTPRRLLNATLRDRGFLDWARSPALAAPLRVLLGTRDVRLSQSHHNCLMTKHPGYSSETLWHQDVRYWAFDRPELISAWLALTSEHARNGALRIVPGSHTLELTRDRFDAQLFFRTDLEANAELLARERSVELEPGDVLLFHCRALHAAGRNATDQVKLSVVFTYHAGDNHPKPGTRSTRLESLPLGPDDAAGPAGP